MFKYSFYKVLDPIYEQINCLYRADRFYRYQLKIKIIHPFYRKTFIKISVRDDSCTFAAGYFPPVIEDTRKLQISLGGGDTGRNTIKAHRIHRIACINHTKCVHELNIFAYIHDEFLLFFFSTGIRSSFYRHRDKLLRVPSPRNGHRGNLETFPLTNTATHLNKAFVGNKRSMKPENLVEFDFQTTANTYAETYNAKNISISSGESEQIRISTDVDSN